MKGSLFLVALFLTAFVSQGTPLEDFVSAARSKHGSAGEKAAQFLARNMPERDQTNLTAAFLIENLDLAFKARAEFSWAQEIPEDLFLNDVLPYAVFDERRDSWRADFYTKAARIARDAHAQTPADVAQALNKEIFKLINVHYNTGRKRANQSPAESVALGKATCTGLAIILVDACRAVGVPARAVGTPMWTNERGNHTWVEVWDGQWHFTGADEYDAVGLDRGWFTGDAALARADSPRYSIYATTWKRDGLLFPTPWSRHKDVAAVNVTLRYAKEHNPDAANLVSVGVRLWDKPDGQRLTSKLCVFDGERRQCGVAETKAGTADLNDMPTFKLRPGVSGNFRFTVNGEARELSFGPLTNANTTVDAIWSQLAGSKETP
jgi:transglutaminase-like putative cysteine protease